MAVASETSRISYAGNNSTVTAYTVPFPFLENSHLAAIAKTAAGVETSVTLANHTGAGAASGGTVTTTVAVPTTSTLTIFREVPATQTTSYEEGGDFPAASHERALDKLTMLGQQNARKLGRSLRVTEASGALNEVVAVANSVLALDASGQPKAMTLAEFKTYLGLSGVTLDVDAGMKTAADSGERALAVPDFAGQLLTQRDTGVIYLSTGTSAGNWTAVTISLTLAGIDSGLFTADATGRGKFASGFVNADLIAATLDLSSKTVTLPALSVVTGWLANGAVTAPKVANGFPVQVVNTASAATATISATIPWDNTIPQNSEGTELTALATTITPTSNTNKVLVRVDLQLASDTNWGGSCIAALFRDSVADALSVRVVTVPQATIGHLTLEFLDSPATASATTYKLRLGYIGAALYVNSGVGTSAPLARFNNTFRSTMTCTEIKSA
jgi:hypothetical protein